MKNAIEVNDVTMQFRLSDDRISSIKEFTLRLLTHSIHYSMFEALKHVSFAVKEGEVIGLIGKNGAGKSTLLKVISGILKPTEGTVSVNGRIAPMLELGSGFDMDLTGRENIFLNGAILGYEEQFLKDRFDAIVHFSELENFLDVPLRNYSSGMITRLGFSIAAIVEPEILIVDEVLAVGDIQFQKKSHKRMKELMQGGTTVLFVSHDINQIKELCDRVVWLENGAIRGVGRTDEMCSAYEQANQ